MKQVGIARFHQNVYGILWNALNDGTRMEMGLNSIKSTILCRKQGKRATPT